MKQRLLLVVLASSGLLISGAATYWLTKDDNHLQKINNQPPTATASTKPLTLKGSYLISGDVFWGRGIDYYAQRTALGHDWPFSGLKDFHPERYNGWIADMECPVTDKSVPYATQVKSLIFSCSPAYLTAAAKWFEAMTLANNHTNNTGLDGFADTQTNLTKAGIQPFGHYDLGQKQDLCGVIALKAKLNNQAVKLPIAMCGYHWLSRNPTAGELGEISRYAKYFPVWVFPHGGTEYATHHNAAQQALYRQMIDLGADTVFGDHPHTVQDTEAYKGRLIAYSVGNLIFDQWFDEEVTKSLIINVRVSAKSDDNLQAYLKLAKSCEAFKDSCLKMAKNQGLKAPELAYGYRLLAGDSSNASIEARLKRPAGAEVKAWLLERTQWARTIRTLNKAASQLN